jgi:phosphoheptose isomerase
VKTAAILAGGKGERLRSIIDDRPKVLAPVNNRPFLVHLLDQLSEAGVERVVLCVGYLADQVEQALGPRHGTLSLVYSRENEPLDTGGALRLALADLDDDPVLVLNGDSFCELDFSALYDWHTWKRASATIALTYLQDVQRFGSVKWLSDGRIAQFREKDQQGAGWINAGIYLLARSVLESIPFGSRKSLERDCFPALAQQRLLYSYPGGKRFIDIGTPESYREAQHFFVERCAELSQGNGTGSRRYVLLDRDGTVNTEKNYLSHSNELDLLPGAVEALGRLQEMGLGLAVITNQSGVGRGYFDLQRVESIHERLRELLADGGVHLDGIYFCPHSPVDNCYCRKPAPGMIYQAAAELGLDPRQSFLVGDKLSDIELGKVVGATTFLVRTGYGDQLLKDEEAAADYVVADLQEASTVIERIINKGPGNRDNGKNGAKAPASQEVARHEVGEQIRDYLLASAEANRRAAENCTEAIAAAAHMIASCLRRGGKLLICGNGGSAAQGQHMAAEFVSTLNKHVRRPGMAAISLTTDTSILTAVSNDFGFAEVFERQVEALGRPGDVLLALSTSGNSENAVRAVERAKRQQIQTIALVGANLCTLTHAADVSIRVPIEDTQHIQEVHMAIEHILCVLVEEAVLNGERP